MASRNRAMAQLFCFTLPQWSYPEFAAAIGQGAVEQLIHDWSEDPREAEIIQISPQQARALGLGLVDEAIESVRRGQPNFLLSRPGSMFYEAFTRPSSS